MHAFRLILPFVRENRNRILLGLFCLLFVDGLQLLIPRIVKHAVDALADGRASLLLLAKDGGLIVAMAILIGGFRYGWRHGLIGTSRRIEKGLREAFFSHLLTLDAHYYDTTRTGDLMSHATSDINHIRMATGMGIVAVTDAVVLGGAAIGFMLFIHPKLALLALIPMPFIVLVTRSFGRRMFSRYKAVQEGLSTITEHVREAVDGIRVVKVFGLGAASERRLEGLSREYVKRNLRLIRVTGSLLPVMIFLSGSATAVVVGFGGRLTIDGLISAGDFVAFLSYLGLLTWPMMAMGWMTNLIQRGKASLERLAVIFEHVPKVADPDDPEALPDGPADLILADVAFSFDGNRKVLEGISLAVSPGRRIGVVGPPGSGKTTLLSLLLRLHDPVEGAATLGGIPLSRLLLSDIRRRVRFVPQEPWLFSGSIAQNICGMDGQVLEKRLSESVEGAGLFSTIKDLPDGLSTIVGEKGVMLSGGQKQRVALARALYAPSEILVLDDPVSQVDANTAHHMLDALFDDSDRTLVVASHRFSAIRNCDEILVLEDGRIRARGTHEALVETDAYYRETWRLQSLAMEIEEDGHA